MSSDRSPGEANLAVRQQAAVAHLGQLGLRVRDLDEVLREALVAVAGTLGVRDAALFEVRTGGQVLEARAGLLDGQIVGRHALHRVELGVDDRSLPGYAVLVGHTIVAPDLHHDARFQARAGEFSFPGKAGIAAPIGWDERPIGLLVAYDREQRSWTDDDVHFMQAVANTIGLAMQRSRVERDLRDSSARLATSLSAGGLGGWSWELDRDRVELSPSTLAMFGIADGRFGGTAADVVALVHPDDRTDFRHSTAAEIEPLGEQHIEFRIIRPDNGEVRWIESWGRPIETEARGHHRVGVCSDITARRLADQLREELLEREHAARVEAEAARERLAFLAEASAVLSSSLDPSVTVSSIAELCIPGHADICFIDLLDDGGHLYEAAASSMDADLLEAAEELRARRKQLGPDAPTQTGHIAALEGKAISYPAITDEQMRGAAVDDEHYRLFLRVDARSTILAPLMSRGRPIGVLTLVRTGSRDPFDDDDLQLVEDLAGRSALAIENGRLFESRARVARSLQAALLPPALPETRGLAIAARYDVAEADVAIGGDFYDVIGLGGDGWGIVVGDVCGRGPDAAALTGLVRHTIRSAVVNESQPSSVLANTNAAILQQIDDSRFCTAAFLRAEVVDPATGAVEISVASAGHPRPILVRATGEAEPLDCAGTLLGVVDQPRLAEVHASLGAGDAVVLYTDGVTEARRGADLFGERRLVGVLQQLAGHPAEVMATGVEAAVAAFRRSARDDTAILVVQAVASP